MNEAKYNRCIKYLKFRYLIIFIIAYILLDIYLKYPFPIETPLWKVYLQILFSPLSLPIWFYAAMIIHFRLELHRLGFKKRE